MKKILHESIRNINIIKQQIEKTSLLQKPIVPTNNFIIAKGDSGASKHYFTHADTKVLQNVTPLTSTKVILPDNSMLTSSHVGMLPIKCKHLSQQAKSATVLKNLKSSSLISLGQLCDDNCNVILTKEKIQIVKDNEIV